MNPIPERRRRVEAPWTVPLHPPVDRAPTGELENIGEGQRNKEPQDIKYNVIR